MIGDKRHSGGVVLWTPAQLTSSLGWFDGADTSSVSMKVDGSNGVEEWFDKNGSGRTFFNTTASDRPRINIRSMNGLNVLFFDGVNDSLLMEPGYTDSIYTVCMVYRSDTTTTKKITIGSNGFAELELQNFYFQINSGAVLGTGFGASIINRNMLLGYTIDGVNSRLTQDGSVLASGNAGNGNWGTTTAWLGSDIGSTPYMNGLLPELVIFSGNDVGERQAVEGYLAWKWGLVSNLPSGHPYKNNPPQIGDI